MPRIAIYRIIYGDATGNYCGLFTLTAVNEQPSSPLWCGNNHTWIREMKAKIKMELGSQWDLRCIIM